MSPPRFFPTLLIMALGFGSTLGHTRGDAPAPVIYKLAAGSTYQEGCFDPCLCPIGLPLGVHGIFQLTFLGFDGIFWVYAVDQVSWTVHAGDTLWSVTGSGSYRVGGEFASMYQLELDLAIDDRPVQHFDSGVVVGGGAFPRIEALISMNNMFCYDIVFDLRAHPYGDDDEDGDVDLDDYAGLAECFAGPGAFPLPQPPSTESAYTCLEVFDGDGDLDIDLRDFQVFQQAFTALGISGGPRVGNYSNSGCLPGDPPPSRGDQYPWCGDDTLELAVSGYTLHVAHRNATYNCCAEDLVVSLALHENQLRLTEVEVLAFPCDCMCCYDVESTVIDLRPGTYVVEYCWLDWETGEDMCLVEEITVACFTNGDCPEQHYCDKPTGSCNGLGTCLPLPELCFDIWIPACGCDGETYSNTCYAHREGVNLAADGACPGGCFSNEDCAPLGYCLTPPAACDGPGACVGLLPDNVQCLAVWDPVCGCDGLTYSNACYAAKAAVSIAYFGDCVP